jgi:hypothetical protein
LVKSNTQHDDQRKRNNDVVGRRRKDNDRNLAIFMDKGDNGNVALKLCSFNRSTTTDAGLQNSESPQPHCSAVPIFSRI